MAGRIFLRVLFALVLLAVVGGLGVYVYNSGVAQGMLASGQAAAPAGSAQVAPYAAPYFYRPWGFGWGFFGWVIPALIGFFIVSVLVRMLIFGSFFAHGHAQGLHGWRGRWHGAEGGQVPPMVAEWHRKMHEASSEPESK